MSAVKGIAKNHAKTKVRFSNGRAIANIRQFVKEGEVRLHPMISRLVEKDTLKNFVEMNLKQRPDQMADADGEVH